MISYAYDLAIVTTEEYELNKVIKRMAEAVHRMNLKLNERKCK